MKLIKNKKIILIEQRLTLTKARYQMIVFEKKLKDNKISQSTFQKGYCLDNSPIEIFST